MTTSRFAVLVMPGLDPGIHLLRKNPREVVLRKKACEVDCRVKPGNDDLLVDITILA
jgi:hypothetical protein